MSDILHTDDGWLSLHDIPGLDDNYDESDLDLPEDDIDMAVWLGCVSTFPVKDTCYCTLETIRLELDDGSVFMAIHRNGEHISAFLRHDPPVVSYAHSRKHS